MRKNDFATIFWESVTECLGPIGCPWGQAFGTQPPQIDGKSLFRIFKQL